jgi:RNA-directed DNA polymerase
MSDKRQNNQQQLAFLFDEGSEASGSAAEGTEALRAERATESPAGNQQVMEAICERENVREALQRVKANKGSPGIDGMTVEQLPDYLKQHWPAIREQLLSGTYQPQPVKRVEISKPDGGGAKAWHSDGDFIMHFPPIALRMSCESWMNCAPSLEACVRLSRRV